MSVLVGDCVEVMAGMDPDSVDAVVTDPPYGIGFMGRDWDDAARLASVPPSGQAMDTPLARFRTGKGPAAVAFDGRSFQSWSERWATAALRVAKPGAYLLAFGGTRTVHRMTVALEDAGWVIRDMLVWAYAQGFPKSRSSLKPAWEPIVLARKPGPLRELGIDAARIPTTQAERDWMKATARPNTAGQEHIGDVMNRPAAPTVNVHDSGRWPSNVLLAPDAPIFDGGWDGVVGGGESHSGAREGEYASGGFLNGAGPVTRTLEASTGTYSRFFLLPKAPTSERTLTDGRRSPHPTQKPEALIRHLVRLVVPPGGVVLDCFLGSGTLGVVCDGLGMSWIGIERDPEYAQWAEDRIADGRPRWDVA